MDTATAIPRIDPVPFGTVQPPWSVMIPTYNCARFLRETVESVLEQDPGPDRMQIEVVDDCSTEDDPEAVVSEVGKGRVAFFRKTKNEGATANFNTCIERSKGALVHILHGDDCVSKGFYDTIGQMAANNPDSAFFATRTIAVDEEGAPKWMSPRMKALEQSSHDVRNLVMEQCFQTPSVVVRRSFYEQHGVFDAELVHCADWEMWVRAVRLGGGVVHPEPLARYRIFQGNDTSRLARTGENVLDRQRLINRFAGLPGFDQERFTSDCAKLALAQARKFASLGDTQSAAANRRVYYTIEPARRRIGTARAGLQRLARFAGLA